MIDVPNTYLGISANKLSCIAAELEQKNIALTAMNVHLQNELEEEHTLAEALGHDCERLKDENTKLRELVADLHLTADEFSKKYERPFYIDKFLFRRDHINGRMRELGIEVE